ncbi:MAG: group 1 truncated hemoglobin [Nitrospira sp.]|nr:group 1 truncated hemoglobin [Nitrospira sp.]
MRRLATLLVVAVLTTTGCSFLTGGKAATDDRTLYERLGGTGPITAVVGKFVTIVGGDKRINGYFAKADLVQLKKHLINMVCQASGGPCEYTGRDMKTTHKGMGITDAAFGALVEDLIEALDTFNVPEREKGELLSVLGPMKGDIVEK